MSALDKASVAVSERQRVAADLVAAAEQLLVTNNDEAEHVRSWLVDVRAYRDEVDAERRGITDPLNEDVKRVNDLFRGPLATLDAIKNQLTSRLSEYALAAAEQQRKALAAASELHAQGNHMAAREALQVNNTEASKVMPQGSSVREVWVPEIVDAGAVPREYCVPDEKRIKALGRATPGNANPTPIAGVSWLRKAEVRVRNKR